jgi:hypothetical protein
MISKQDLLERADELTKIMKETSLPLTHEPKKLFHATPRKNFSAINENGINPNPIYGEVYFCEKEKDCLKFVQKPCIIFEVDPKKLDMENMFLSREAKKWQAFQYYDHVPKEAIKNWKSYS